MAKAIVARRQGDEFQAIFFWDQLVSLLTDDTVKLVTFESDQQIFVDDVVVEYSKPLIDDQTGQQYVVDAYQCKYHVAKSFVFTADMLVDPKFLKNKQSMLQRLYDAFQKYSASGELFRLHVVSSSSWDTHDPFCRFLSTENHIRSSFYEKAAGSIQGKIRSKFADHLGISETELRPFLDKVRFDTGINRKKLTQALDTKLRLAGLVKLDKTITNTRHLELAWKWMEQGNHSFSKQEFEQLIRKEKLIDVYQKNLLLIRHQSLDPIMPDAIRDELPDDLRNMPYIEYAIDLTHLFSDGRLTNPRLAISEQQEKTNEIRQLYKANPHLELAYYGIAHIPLVFWLGYQLNARKSINIFEHNRENNKWNLLQVATTFPDLLVRGVSDNAGSSGTDVIIKFGISYPVMDSDLNQIAIESRSTMELTLSSPTLDVVRNVGQLEKYALAFRAMLDEIHNFSTPINRIHVFYAGPVSLAFRCGQLISPTIHPKILVYNYSSQDTPKYKWGIQVNTPVDSPDFLVQL